MPAQSAVRALSPDRDTVVLDQVAVFSRLRALAWDKDVLYGSRGYTLLRAGMNPDRICWEPMATYSPAWWRNATAASRFTFRLCRDGFHALAVLPSGYLVAAAPGAIITLAPGEPEFQLSFRILRGTRPLHIAVTPNDHVFWGEYFDNPRRDEVHIYASADRGATWDVAYTFPRGAIRHVHNIFYDEWARCLWVLTGDNGSECRMLRASCDFRQVEVVLSGSQQTRAVALVPASEGLYFSSDTPLERNHVYFTQVAPLSSSSISGCRAGEAIFFSTMVEPSRWNQDRNVRLFGSRNGFDWRSLRQWQKDGWPMSLFQYGNAILPDGRNTSGLLALSTVAVRGTDLETSLWRVTSW